METPAPKDPDELLTAKEVGAILKLRSTSAVIAVMRRIPGLVLIGDGVRPQLRVPRWALDRWIAEGGDRRWRSGEDSRVAAAMDTIKPPSPSRLQERFPGHDPTRSGRRSRKGGE